MDQDERIGRLKAEAGRLSGGALTSCGGRTFRMCRFLRIDVLRTIAIGRCRVRPHYRERPRFFTHPPVHSVRIRDAVAG